MKFSQEVALTSMEAIFPTGEEAIVPLAWQSQPCCPTTHAPAIPQAIPSPAALCVLVAGPLPVLWLHLLWVAHHESPRGPAAFAALRRPLGCGGAKTWPVLEPYHPKYPTRSHSAILLTIWSAPSAEQAHMPLGGNKDSAGWCSHKSNSLNGVCGAVLGKRSSMVSKQELVAHGCMQDCSLSIS